jgi:hypothetical protein
MVARADRGPSRTVRICAPFRLTILGRVAPQMGSPGRAHSLQRSTLCLALPRCAVSGAATKMGQDCPFEAWWEAPDARANLLLARRSPGPLPSA